MAIHSSLLPRKSQGRGAWRATVHGVTKSQTRPITCVHMHTCAHTQLMCLHLGLPLFGSCFPYFVPDVLFLPSFFI